MLPSSASGLLHYRQLLERAWASVDAAALDRVLAALWATYQAGGTVLIFGNGGSATTASHFSVDLTKGTLGREGDLAVEPCRSLALADNSGLITAWANDTRFDRIYAEQIHAWARPGDLAFAISASGNSSNVLQAVEEARGQGLVTVGLSGFGGGRLAGAADHGIVVDAADYGVVEDVHLSLTHVICYWVHEQFRAGHGRSRPAESPPRPTP
ncbi:MAG TPA: SIS domain-containing protein [Dehalococcoidia bacterium]|nr:SIS domain-containing protein [Dehalococcoidia bacterium]